MEADQPTDDPRFAYVVWHFPKLSETFVIEELTAIAELGLRPLVIARDEWGSEPENDRATPFLSRTTWLGAASRWAQAGTVAAVVARHPARVLRCLALALSTRSRGVLANLWYACLLSQHVERERLRYLHAHFADTAGDLVLFAATIASIPYGLTVHAVDIYLGHLLCQKLEGARLWVTVCRYNLAEIGARCPDADLSRALIKYAGVDTEHFKLESPRPLRAAERVLAIGRLTPKKGFDQLIEAMARLRSEGFVNLRCTIIGEGRCREDLTELIADRGLDAVVELAGSLAPDEVRAHLAEADVLVSPCTVAATGNRDSMPVVIKEAMAMELPVVATDDFGIPEMVSSETGALFPRDDLDGLVDALRSIITSSAPRRAEMGRNGRRTVVERFDERSGAVALADRIRTVATQVA